MSIARQKKNATPALRAVESAKSHAPSAETLSASPSWTASPQDAAEDRQALAERAALGSRLRSDGKDALAATLLDLFVEAAASGENRTPCAILDGAISTLADDLDALYNAITDDAGHCVDYGLELDRVPMMIWRLSIRARAAVEVASRLARLARLDAEAKEAAQ